jgi:methionyl-tRNA formyltransferase
VLLEKRTPIAPGESTFDLNGRLAVLGSQAIVEALAALERLQPRVQDHQLATYAAKVAKAEARIDWRQPNTLIDRQVRAFNPAPGAEARLHGQAIKVWRASPCAGDGLPGAVLASDGGALRVACGEGALAITHLQRPGGRRLSAEEFLLGTPIPRGAVLE